jgi:hypothetical protein
MVIRGIHVLSQRPRAGFAAISGTIDNPQWSGFRS